MTAGLLDAPALAWRAIDGVLATLQWPAAARIALYGVASAWLCMAIYRRCSGQARLAQLAGEMRAARHDLAHWDGPFDGLLTRVGRVLRLSARHLRLTLGAALLSGLPVLFVLPWLSNTFGHVFPAAGEPVAVRVEAPQPAPPGLRWEPEVAARASGDPKFASAWQVAWPAEGQSAVLRHDARELLQLPLAAAVPVVHVRRPLWNTLVGNPAGYLAEDAPVQAIAIDLPPRELLPVGPRWARGWLAWYLLPLLLASVWLRFRWRLH